MNQPADTKPAPPALIRYRIVHLIYATAALGISLGTFGLGGLFVGPIIVGAWAFVFFSRSRPIAFAPAAVVLLILFCLGGLALVRLPTRPDITRMSCSNNLKQIAIALHNYHDTYKAFPPPVVYDESGKPMHSWRVLISPFIESSPFFDMYDLNEPWDGPHNSQIAPQPFWVYRCPRHGTNRGTPHTDYVAVIGPKTAWPDEGSAFRYLLDGAEVTMLVLELASSDIHWMEPRDISYEEAMKLLTRGDGSATGPHRHEDFFYIRSVGPNAAFADGSVKLIPKIAPAVAGAILTRDDGLVKGYESAIADIANFEIVLREEPRLRIANCIRLAVFILIALWPLPWVWIHPRGSTPTSPEVPSQAQ